MLVYTLCWVSQIQGVGYLYRARSPTTETTAHRSPYTLTTLITALAAVKTATMQLISVLL